MKQQIESVTCSKCHKTSTFKSQGTIAAKPGKTTPHQNKLPTFLTTEQKLQIINHPETRFLCNKCLIPFRNQEKARSIVKKFFLYNKLNHKIQ